MTRNDRRSGETSARLPNFTDSPHLAISFLAFPQGLSTASSRRSTSTRTVFAEAVRPVSEKHRLFLRNLQDCKFRASSARALLQDGNGWMQRAEEGTSTESGESKLEYGGTRANYSEEGIPNRRLVASRGINRSPTDSSLWFLTYNRRREQWDFWDTDRRAAVMHFARNTDVKIRLSPRLVLTFNMITISVISRIRDITENIVLDVFSELILNSQVLLISYI